VIENSEQETACSRRQRKYSTNSRSDSARGKGQKKGSPARRPQSMATWGRSKKYRMHWDLAGSKVYEIRTSNFAQKKLKRRTSACYRQLRGGGKKILLKIPGAKNS